MPSLLQPTSIKLEDLKPLFDGAVANGTAAKDFLASENFKTAKLAAVGALSAGAAILLIRRAERKATAIEIVSLDALLQYQNGGLLRDVGAWIITPRVTAVRVTGHGDRIPKLPAGLWNLVRLKELRVHDNALTELPAGLGRLVALKDLDVAGNQLRTLPEEISRLTALSALNAMNNQLESLPQGIGALKSLIRLGLKGNALRSLPPTIGTLTSLKELFLTDNPLESLPEEIGGCQALVKLQASHNALTTLPAALGSLPNLELLRVACGNISSLPPEVAASASLAWLSFAANPVCVAPSPRRQSPPVIKYSDLEIGRKLGDGASGEVFEATWKGKRVAFKRFLAHRSPDGHSSEEIAIACAVSDRHLIKVVARVDEPLGLVMDYVEGATLADKPNSASLLRCRWPAGSIFNLGFVLRVATGVAAALEAMHARGLIHGDVYAHNVMADEQGHATLCDYGAAFYAPKGSAAALEGHEARAYGLLLRDLVQRLDFGFDGMEAALDTQKQLLLIVQQCMTGPPPGRPRMAEITRKLKSLTKAVVSKGVSPSSSAR